ncbi:tetratricopeptide repeat protein [Rhodovibrionaceae bacterium A322]
MTSPSSADPALRTPSPAEALLLAGKDSQALTLCQELLAQNPHDPIANHVKGMVLYRSGQADDGIAIMQTALERDSSDPVRAQQLAMACLHSDKLEQAAETIELGLTSSPRHAPLIMVSAEVHLRGGDRASAETDCQEALAINPGLRRASHLLATLLCERGELEEAVVHFAQARDSEKPPLDPLGNFAWSLLALGRSPELLTFAPSTTPIQGFCETLTLAVAAWQMDDMAGLDQALTICRQQVSKTEDAPNQRFLVTMLERLNHLQDFRQLNTELYQSQSADSPAGQSGETAAEEDSGRQEDLLFLVGDEQALSAGHLRVPYDGGVRHLVPLTTPGLKVWHLVRPRPSRHLGAFLASLQRLPDGAHLVVALGEQDLRMTTGLHEHIRRNPDLRWRDLVDGLVTPYVAALSKIAESKNFTITLQTPPASAMISALLKRGDRVAFEEAHKRFCRLLMTEGQARGFKILDLNRVTRDASGAVKRQHYFDNSSLRPGIYREAFEQALLA